MSKVTSKFQVTLPRAIAREQGLTPGTNVDFEALGGAVRIRNRQRQRPNPDRLKLFDRATQRQREREAQYPIAASKKGRGWKREDLYARGTMAE